MIYFLILKKNVQHEVTHYKENNIQIVINDNDEQSELLKAYEDFQRKVRASKQYQEYEDKFQNLAALLDVLYLDDS